MAPQDDLTAERAAKLIQSVFLANEKEWRTWYAIANSGTAQQPAPDGVAQRLVDVVADALKTARQEALREAAKVVSTEMWDDYAKARLIVIARELDRLASEEA